jgi:hypothetical protein
MDGGGRAASGTAAEEPVAACIARGLTALPATAPALLYLPTSLWVAAQSWICDVHGCTSAAGDRRSKAAASLHITLEPFRHPPVTALLHTDVAALSHPWPSQHLCFLHVANAA